jgi:hypothetical protein
MILDRLQDRTWRVLQYLVFGSVCALVLIITAAIMGWLPRSSQRSREAFDGVVIDKLVSNRELRRGGSAWRGYLVVQTPSGDELVVPVGEDLFREATVGDRVARRHVEGPVTLSEGTVNSSRPQESNP